MKFIALFPKLTNFKWVVVLLLFAIINYSPKLVSGQVCDSNDLNQGLVSALSKSGKAFGNLDQVCVLGNDASYRDYKVPSYKDLENQYYTLSRSSFRKEGALPRGTSSTVLDFGRTNGANGIYLHTGDLNITGVSGTDNTQVIFVRGNLNINGNITGPTGETGGLVFIVNGNINIDATVTTVNAVLIASGNGKICTTYSGTCINGTDTSQLTVNGSLISINKNNLPIGTPAIWLGRNLLDNELDPAEIINKQPKYLYNLRGGLFTKDLVIITEDKHYVIPNLVAPSPSPSVAPSPSASPTPPPDTLTIGLVSYWKMDETNSPVTLNDTLNLNNGTAVGTGVTNVAQSFKSAGRSFSGVADNYISIPNSTTLNPDQITISVWVKPTSATHPASSGIIAKGTGAGGEVYALDFPVANNYTPRFYFWNNSALVYVNAQSSLPLNRWSHIVAGYFVESPSSLARSAKAKIYVNGVLSGSADITGPLAKNTHIISVGCRQSGSGSYDLCFPGQIDELAIWGKALIESEYTKDVSQLYNCGNGNQYPFAAASSCPLPPGYIQGNPFLLYTTYPLSTTTLIIP